MSGIRDLPPGTRDGFNTHPAGVMGKSPFDRAWIPRDLRRVLDALVASAIGTMAGLLVDSGFGLRASVINVVYELLQPLFGLFSDFPVTQLMVAELVYRIPVVLIVGMLVGLLLRHIHYRRLALWSIAVWPACLLAGTLVSVIAMHEVATPAAAPAIPRIGSVAEFLVYLPQYSLLVVVALGAEAAVSRAARAKAG